MTLQILLGVLKDDEWPFDKINELANKGSLKCNPRNKEEAKGTLRITVPVYSIKLEQSKLFARFPLISVTFQCASM